MIARVLALLLIAGMPISVSAQSLAEIAKKEKQRREGNGEKGVEARTFSEGEIFGEDDDEPPAATDGPEDEGTPGAVSRPNGQSLIPDGIGSDLGEDETRLSSDQDAARRNEAYWQSRLQQAQAAIDSARQRVEFFKELHLVPGESYIDADGNAVIRSLDHLRELVAEADADLQTSLGEPAAIREEARKAGVPPGWLR